MAVAAQDAKATGSQWQSPWAPDQWPCLRSPLEPRGSWTAWHLRAVPAPARHQALAQPSLSLPASCPRLLLPGHRPLQTAQAPHSTGTTAPPRSPFLVPGHHRLGRVPTCLAATGPTRELTFKGGTGEGRAAGPRGSSGDPMTELGPGTRGGGCVSAPPQQEPRPWAAQTRVAGRVHPGPPPDHLWGPRGQSQQKTKGSFTSLLYPRGCHQTPGTSHLPVHVPGPYWAETVPRVATAPDPT